MRSRRVFQLAPLSGVLTALVLAGYAGRTLAAELPQPAFASVRVTQPIDETKLVSLVGNIHPLALPKFDRGPVPDSLPMEHMFLQLRRTPEQEEALKAKIVELQNPNSSNYHKWLTADELGKNYGPAQQDIDAVVEWLGSHGFQVNLIHKNGLTIDLSGNAGQVSEAFHTEIHHYEVKSRLHIANVSNPKIPSALASVVSGFVSLNDFMPKSQLKKRMPAYSFPYSGSEQYDEAPADFATIYNVAPLYGASKPITGKGQTVVVLEDTDVNPADVTTFRSAFGLSKYSGKFAQVHPGTGCSDPGKNGAEGEAALDAEWAGAIAPDATVNLASCADTATNFGGFIAAQNLLDGSAPPPIMSLSYLSCEAGLGPGGNSYVNSLWQQAAGEGVSVFVAAGDGGPAGCDDFDDSSYALAGIAANGFASTPYNVATGGTDFRDTVEDAHGTYWNTTNSTTGKSAKSYIPEIPWNDSCASSVLFVYLGYPDEVTFCNSDTGSNFLDIVGGSGAPSFVYSKPSWQAGISGVPNDGVRDLPDVSLFASNGLYDHAILFCMSDAAEGGVPCKYSTSLDAIENSAGGTSFTAPQFASIQALINQKAGGPQGNPDPVYYSLAKKEYGTSTAPNTSGAAACNGSAGTGGSNSCVFHDVTFGNNDVPCYGTSNCYAPVAGGYGALSTQDKKFYVAFPSYTGYDLATGLGSVNVTNLVNVWP